MGLDGVELVMEVEDRFKTKIPDVECEKMETVGALCDFLMKRIEQRESGGCVTASMFYPLRRILVDGFAVSRTDVVPDAKLNELVPVDRRREFRASVIEQLRTDLPGLVRSKRFQVRGDLFPDQMKTVGQLAEICAAELTVSEEFGVEDEALVWAEVCTLVASVAHVDVDTLKRSTHFQRDLWF